MVTRKKGWLSIYEPKPESNYNGPRGAAGPVIDEIMSHIEQHGSRQKPEFNGKTAKIMKLAGGYRALCGMKKGDAVRAIQSAYREVPA